MRAAATAAFLLVAACGAGSDPAGEESRLAGDAGGPAPAGPAQTSPAPELENAPLAMGSWFFRERDGEAAALFGPPASEAVFTIRCDAQAGQVHFLRSGRLEDDAATMRLVADDGSVTLDARRSGTQLPQVESVLTAGAPFVRTLARETARLGVAIGEESLLVMPGDAAIGRALGGCVEG